MDVVDATTQFEEGLADALAQYPGMLLWDHLRQNLPADVAASVYEAAADAVRASKK